MTMLVQGLAPLFCKSNNIHCACATSDYVMKDNDATVLENANANVATIERE